MRTYLRLVVLGVVLALGLAGLAPPSTAVHLTCGQTVSGNVVLDSDIGPCDGHGLVVGANNTRINLNGHTITGTGGSNVDGDRDAGILVQGRKKVTITSSAAGGLIQTFWHGINLTNANKNKILGGAGLTLSGNTDEGLKLNASSKNRVQGLTVTGTLEDDGIDATHVNGKGSHKNKFLGNNVFGNDDDGFEIESSNKNVIKGNTVAGNEEGVLIEGTSKKNKVVKNTITGNTDDGIETEDSSGKNKILKNLVQGSADDGINIDSTGPRNLVKGNVTGVHPKSGGTGNSGDGIDVEAGTGNKNQIIANIANGNGVDGIHVENPKTIVSNNTANNNVDNGLDLVAGVKGGGNKASGNGAANCTLPKAC